MGRPLFEGFLGTMKRSDSLHLCITVVPRGFTVRTCRSLDRPEAGPPGFRTPCFDACQRSPTPPGPSPPCQNGVDSVAFRVFGARRHPGVARFRGSILCLRVPLSTLRRRRYRRLRMTRGQCGWLNLHCQGLAPFTTVPACPGADPNAGHELLPKAGAQRTLSGVDSSRLILIEAPSPADHRGMLRVGKPGSRIRRRPQGDCTPRSSHITAALTSMPVPCISASSTSAARCSCIAR
jgi:hypothetical protein